ncbi:MAG: MFS transporter [Pseudomonadales bacterium]
MTVARPSKAVVLVSSATAFSLLGDQALYAILPIYFTELGLLPFQVGILLSANRWIRLVTNHVAHVLAERFAPAPLFVGAFVLGATITFAYALYPTFALLLAARILWGLAWSFIRHIGVLALLQDVPGTRTAQTMGYYNGISRLGSIGGLFGGALLFDLFGYTNTFWILGFLGLASVVLSWPAAPPKLIAPEPATTDSGDHLGRHLGLLWLGFTLGGVGPGLVISTLGLVLNTRLEGELVIGGFTLGAATLTGAVLAARFLMDTVAAPWLGALGDELGPRRATTAFFAAGALMLALAAYTTELLPLCASIIAFFMCGTALHAMVAGVAGKQGGQRYARYVSATDLGAAAGPLLGWLAVGTLDAENFAIVLAAGMYFLATTVAPFTFPKMSG